MIAVLLLAQTDSTGRTISWIVFALVAVAAALALLTAWYWRVTDPAKRQESSNRGGGPRKRRSEAPDPEPISPPSNDMTPPVIPTGTVPAAGSTPDQTRVLTRADILEPKVSNPPPVIDLRVTTPEPAEPARSQDRFEPSPEPAENETVINLVELETEDPSVTAASGAHDNGMDFDDWLALAEED